MMHVNSVMKIAELLNEFNLDNHSLLISHIVDQVLDFVDKNAETLADSGDMVKIIRVLYNDDSVRFREVITKILSEIRYDVNRKITITLAMDSINKLLVIPYDIVGVCYLIGIELSFDMFKNDKGKLLPALIFHFDGNRLKKDNNDKEEEKL